MTRPEWEPLTTAEAVVAAFEARRHVEFTACGNAYDLPPSYENGSRGWIQVDPTAEGDVRCLLDTPCCRFRARIEGGAE